MKDTLSYIVTAIVEDPDKVKIDEDLSDPETTHLVISVAPEDMGKVIGKGGKVIRAIRSVMKIPAIKENKKIYITIGDQEQNQDQVQE